MKFHHWKISDVTAPDSLSAPIFSNVHAASHVAISSGNLKKKTGNMKLLILK